MELPDYSARWCKTVLKVLPDILQEKVKGYEKMDNAYFTRGNHIAVCYHPKNNFSFTGEKVNVMYITNYDD